MLNDGSRDGSFLLGISYEDVSDITGAEFVEEQDVFAEIINYVDFFTHLK